MPEVGWNGSTYRFGQEEDEEGNDAGCSQLHPYGKPPTVVALDVCTAVDDPACNDGSERPHAIVKSCESSAPLDLSVIHLSMAVT